ncbi:MAG: O-methyltransferase [Oscillospiraceae bacterium]|nr:O-methyltransferase [Oscillospiraceae bacterium]
MKQEILEIKEKALKNHVPIIMDDTLEAIRDVLLKNNPKRILEIGTATGYSALCFFDILVSDGVDDVNSSDIQIDTIELNEERATEAKENIQRVGLENNIRVIVGDAVEVLSTVNEKYDIVFIDASKGKYPVFLEHAVRLSKKGSIIIADNVLYKGYVMSDYNLHKQRTAVRNLREFIKEATTNDILETEILEVGDGLTITKVK